MVSVTRPALLLDKKKCLKNIRFMAEKAQKNRVEFRPHFKTHQSLEIGRWFKTLGVNKITVSSFGMADYFSAEWDDITVAFPVNILEIDTINRLASKIQLNVLVESIETVAFLDQNLKYEVGCFIKIDIGSHRTGMNPEHTEQIDVIVDYLANAEKLHLRGFLGHAGHSYHAEKDSDLAAIHQHSVEIMANLKELYIRKHPDIIISLGDTPTCSLMDDFTGIDEIRPGNFVFYDLMQHYIGSNKVDQIAVALACPIVAIQKDRNEAVVYGGGIHLSKDRMDHPQYGTIFGQVVEHRETGWGDSIDGMFVKSLSQEHGVVAVPESRINDFAVGDVLMILPVHSCMTANLMKEYYTIESGVKIATLNSCT